MIQIQVLEIKKLMLRGHKLDFGCYIFHYLCLWEDGYRASGLLIRCKVCQPDLWSICPDLHRDLTPVTCIKCADWRLGILLQSAYTPENVIPRLCDIECHVSGGNRFTGAHWLMVHSLTCSMPCRISAGHSQFNRDREIWKLTTVLNLIGVTLRFSRIDAQAISASDRPGSFLQTSAGWIGTCDRLATLWLLEITRQPDLASCCTWSISTAGVPHEPPHATTGSTNLVTKPTTPTNSLTRYLKDFMATWMATGLKSLCPSGTDSLSTAVDSFSSSATILSTKVVRVVSIVELMAKRETRSTVQCNAMVV